MFSSTLNYIKQMGNRKSSTPVVVQLTKAEKWKMGITIFTGKILGLIVVLGVMKMLPGMMFNTANAAETYTAHETSMMNSINTVWVLVSAFLVFGMQAGFVMLEAGFARTT
jgi:Amt family ammonium transporter